MENGRIYIGTLAMDNRSLISIIIPCYNDAQYIEQAVNSALCQTYPHKEVIVVDDGSNSKTKLVLKKIEPKITKLITQKNQGQSTARNVGIREARGEFILVLDSDDYFEPTFCEKAIDVFLNNPNVKIVTCDANLLYENGTKGIYKPEGGTVSDFMYSNKALGNAMFNKTDWDTCGKYDEKMRFGFEDWEFFIRILSKGGCAKVIEEPLFSYRKRTHTTTSIANKRKYELMEYIILKHRCLYVDNFDRTVKYLLFQAQLNKKNELKRIKSIEFRLGNMLLKPFRFFKNHK